MGPTPIRGGRRAVAEVTVNEVSGIVLSREFSGCSAARSITCCGCCAARIDPRMADVAVEQLKRLVHEIHRRSLWQVLAIYVGASWVVFEVVQTLTEGLGLPEWFPAFALGLLLIGLPIVLATAFVQEGFPPKRGRDPTLLPTAEPESQPVANEIQGARRLLTWRNVIAGGVLALALWGVVAAGWLLLGQPPGPAADRPFRSIAVLPFADMSPEGDQQYFADGVAEEILDALARLPGWMSRPAPPPSDFGRARST